jgi:hypothetical protein
MQSTAPQINDEGIFFYGYQRSLGRLLVERREIRWIDGLGNGGKRLYVVPDLGLVVAVYATAYGVPQIVGETILKSYVSPSLFLITIVLRGKRKDD